MGGRGGRKPQRKPKIFHGFLDLAWVQCPASGPQKQGAGFQIIGALAAISLYGLLGHRKNRNQPLLPAFSLYFQHITKRRIGGLQTQGL